MRARSFRWSGWVVVGVVWASAGCSPEPLASEGGKCHSLSDCNVGLVCVAGRCTGDVSLIKGDAPDLIPDAALVLVDAGADAASPDAGAVGDGGASPTDAGGPSSDAGTAVDAGARADAGHDAGAGHDASAGTDAGADAGQGDGGAPPAEDGGGADAGSDAGG